MRIALSRLCETSAGLLKPPDEGRGKVLSFRDVAVAARNLGTLDPEGDTMYVRDLMASEVVTLSAGDTLDLADDIMRLGRIRHMPITTNGKLVGILSQRDLFRAAICSVLQLRPAAEREWLAKIPVREVMTTDVVTIAPTAPVHEAVKCMLDKRIGCLPVIEDGTLVGLLSESDCMRYLARLLDLSDAKLQLPEIRDQD